MTGQPAASFSPVAGIKVVERSAPQLFLEHPCSFSPVAGIKVVESKDNLDRQAERLMFQSRCRD